jgi:DUF1365 family protein
MDVIYKGGALLAAQAEGAARLCIGVPLAVLDNALREARRRAGASASGASSSSSAAPSSSSTSRCPFSGLVGSSSASCPGARMAAAAAAAASKAAGGGGAEASNGNGNDATTATCWWIEGRVTHVRRKPVRHAFGYDVRLALLDLDSPPRWFSAQQNDHLTADQARAAAGTTGRVLLLTLPAAAGYVQNPISVYYCYDKEQERRGGGEALAAEGKPAPPLRRCIAEVTNTPWGERVSFVFDPKGAAVPKSLHVSPFMDMRNVWLLKATDPLAALAAAREGVGGNVALSVLVDHPELGRYFDAQFVGKVASSDGDDDATNERSGLWRLWRYGFLPQRVALWIYAHAVLLALKGVRVQPKPGAETYEARAEEALLKEGRQQQQHGTPPIPGGSAAVAGWAGRAFCWRRALRWPWYLD